MRADGTLCDEGMEILLQHYERCLRWRMELWFPEHHLRREGRVMHARRGDQVATLTFLPDICQWELACESLEMRGSFDRASKRMRQLFSFSPR